MRDALLVQLGADGGNRVTELVDALKKKGLDSPYLRNFVVARINPLKFRPPGSTLPPEDALASALAHDCDPSVREEIALALQECGG